MIIQKESVLAVAARELAAKVKEKPRDALEVYRQFRKIEEHRLRMRHNAGAGGRETARQRSDTVDILFREVFENTIEETGAAKHHDDIVVMAFGGYGRREMNPFSDVDIMFVHAGRQAPEVVEELIRRTLTALWDIGFKVGHSTRSIPQALKHANTDMIIKTSMLEARYLGGSREVYNDFKAKFVTSCVRQHEAEYIAWRLANQQELREKYGATVFMQEPNVKYGRGGMRDYQSLLWIAFFKERVASLSKLVELKFLRETERRSLDKAYDFLLRVRTEMHYVNGRPLDHLTLQMQGRVASNFRYPQRHILGKCEAFMRDYYSHTRNIDLITAIAMERMRAEAVKPAGVLEILNPRRSRIEKFDGFHAKDGLLYAESRDIFHEDPSRLIRAFQHIQLRQLNLASDLRELMMRRLGLVNRTFQYARSTRETFLAILSRKGEVGRILRLMHEIGFLGRYLPEFGALTCLVQHEFYHRYTADEHTLVCIEKLDGVLLTEDPKLKSYRGIFQRLEDPSMLYFALLLHDTGKAANRRHHEEQSAILAHRVARRLQLTPERRRQLLLLVDAHYTLSHTSQSRNLEDPATIAEFAGIVKSKQNLDPLMLLTLADGMGTSDQNWSDWKETLVWSLYRRTGSYLESGPRYVEVLQAEREQMREQVERKLGKEFAGETEGHFSTMPDRYFAAYDVPTITEHLRLFREFLERHVNEGDGLVPVFRWVPRPEYGHTEVWICGWSRPGLLERLSGAFLAAQINVLSADIFTRGDDLALDIFRVSDTNFQPVENPRDIARVEQLGAEALSTEEFDFKPLIRKARSLRSYRLSQDVELPTRIVVENHSHPIYTLIDVQSPDRMGLLYDLLRALHTAGVNIELSRITTEMDVAMDTFYVTNRDGNKIVEDAAIKKLQRLLKRAATGGLEET